MHKTRGQATKYAERLAELSGDLCDDVLVFVCPPYTCLAAVADVLRGTGIGVGAQDVHPALEGPYTAEVSVEMVAECGASLVEVGHADRRARLREPEVVIHQKIRGALAGGLSPIVCVGETQEERDAGLGLESVVRQLALDLHGLDLTELRRTIVAYEPVWAIGAERSAPASYIEHILKGARGVISNSAGRDGLPRVRVLYGGSVAADNCEGLLGLAGVDGLFVGRASLDVEEFGSILQAASRCVTGPRPKLEAAPLGEEAG